jgi:deoxyribodipyrimidine photo-lyase
VAVAPERIRALNDAPVRAGRRFVLYWTTVLRRTRFNPALERAADLARELGRPVLVLEALRCDYPYASDRLHVFVMQGMADSARRLQGKALYHPWLERDPGEGRGLLEALSRYACAAVTDDYPTFFIPRMLGAAAPRLDVRLEAVDGSCLVPFRLAGRDFPSAFAYRRFLQRALPEWLDRLPREDPLARAPPPGRQRVPAEIARRWRAVELAELAHPDRAVAALPIDHRIRSCARAGGAAAASSRLRAFLREGLPAYAEGRSDPDAAATSGLSPWLHFGHLSSFEVVRAVLRREGWTRAKLAHRADGKRAGFWGVSPSAEAFLDQIVTWRELGFVTCAHLADHREYESLPAWARATLEKHATDPRPHRYAYDLLAAARTGDRVWNAAQRQLLEDGTIHNTLRMLWGKKILEWAASPREALQVLLDLNDRYALDGRDPNSVSGIFWCLGRYDRPWGPERPIFGTVRTMSSENTRRKVRLERTLSRYAPASGADAGELRSPKTRQSGFRKGET